MPSQTRTQADIVWQERWDLAARQGQPPTYSSVEPTKPRVAQPPRPEPVTRWEKWRRKREDKKLKKQQDKEDWARRKDRPDLVWYGREDVGLLGYLRGWGKNKGLIWA